MNKRHILLLETATSVCSVALSVNGEIISSKELNERNIHATQITLFIAEVMANAGISYSDLDAVAVSKGPGSYTGLRIGVSTAKGLCYGLDLPLIAIDTLFSLTKGLLEENPKEFELMLLIPMIDARRMEVYTAIFDSNLNILEKVNAKIVDKNSFDEFSGKKLAIFGDGAEKFKPIFDGNTFITFPEIQSSARHMAALADDKFLEKEFENLAYFEPFYLKDFIANKPK